MALDELELNEAQAEAIIEKAIEFDVYSDDMPSSKKDKLSTADEIVAFAIDSWVSEGVTPDSDDKETAEAGEQIAEIFELAGVEVDENGEITYGEVPDADGGDDDNGDDDGDEAPIDIGDIIEGYEELTPATRIKKIKALELDPEDDDDYNTLVSIADWEEAQEEPSSRVLNYLNEVLPEEVDGEAEEGDDDAGDGEDGDGEDEPYTEEELSAMEKDELFEVAGEFEVDTPTRLTAAGKKKLVAAILEAQEEDEGEGDEEGEDAEGELEEPWEGYEEASVKDIKEVLNDDERTAEELTYIKEYEESREKPRKAILDLCDKRVEEIEGGDDDPEPEPEPEPKKKAGRRGRRGKTDDPDDSDDVDNAVAKDDEKDAKKKKAGKLVITRDQILEALAEGSVEIG